MGCKMERLNNDERMRYYLLKAEAKSDKVYRTMLTKLTDLERRDDQVLSSLSSEDMDTVCDFVSLLQEIDDRELEIACQNMVYRFEKL